MGFDEFYSNNMDKIDYEDYDKLEPIFEAGAASRQADVDELKKRVKELELINFDSELHFDAAKEHVDNLQKRIDIALNKSEDFYDFGDGESAMAFCNDIINILKGKKDE